MVIWTDHIHALPVKVYITREQVYHRIIMNTECPILQYSIVYYNTAYYIAVQHSILQHSVVYFSIA